MTSARILIVEDQRIVARDLSLRLQRLGHTIAGTVPSGEAAIDHVAKDRPDVIFMDIMLEGPLDGIEAAQRIREFCDAPIIYMTAHSDKATRERAGHVETQGYLVKPFDDEQLTDAIGAALGPSEYRARPAGRPRPMWLSPILAIVQTAGIIRLARSVSRRP
jgi:CheY-like chemotaxis protein